VKTTVSTTVFYNSRGWLMTQIGMLVGQADCKHADSAREAEALNDTVPVASMVGVLPSRPYRVFDDGTVGVFIFTEWTLTSGHACSVHRCREDQLVLNEGVYFSIFYLIAVVSCRLVVPQIPCVCFMSVFCRGSDGRCGKLAAPSSAVFFAATSCDSCFSNALSHADL